MAWIEAHDSLPDHPKTIVTATALRIDKDMLTGKLWRFWTWALDNRASGFIPSIDMATVAEKMRWNKKPEILFRALCMAPDEHKHGFLYEVDGGYMIHDWDVYTHRYRSQEDARKKDRERKQRKKEIPADIQRISTGNNDGTPTEETRNSISYRNLTLEEEKEESVREDEHGNPLPDPEWKKVMDCHLAQIGELGGGAAAAKLQTYVDDMGANVVCLAIEHTNLMGPDSPRPYLLTTLENWSKQGIRDVATAKAHLLDRERRQGKQRGYSPPQRTEPEQPRLKRV